MTTKTINIADILKKKPRGMKLYSPICGDLVVDHIDDDEKIISCRPLSMPEIKYVWFSSDGRFMDVNMVVPDNGECILFPSKALRQWDVTQFKNGDVVVVEEHDLRFDEPRLYIMIFEKCDWSDGVIYFHVLTMANSNEVCDYRSCLGVLSNPYAIRVSCRAAYKREVLEIKQALCEHHLQWNAEKKCVEPLPNEEEQTAPRFKFEPFDKVLVRDGDNDSWQPAFFSVLKEDGAEKFGVIDGYIPTFYCQCIPYNDDTKHLLGTYDPYKPKA